MSSTQNRRPSIPSLHNKKREFDGRASSNSGPPDKPSNGEPEPHRFAMNNKRSVPPGRNSPENVKRNRPLDAANGSSEKHVHYNAASSRQNSTSSAGSTAGPSAYKRKEGPPRAGPVRSFSENTAPMRKGSIDGRSPLSRAMSPASAQGEFGYGSGSGRSTPVQMAPTAPSMTRAVPERGDAAPAPSLAQDGRFVRQAQDAGITGMASLQAMRNRKRLSSSLAPRDLNSAAIDQQVQDALQRQLKDVLENAVKPMLHMEIKAAQDEAREAAKSDFDRQLEEHKNATSRLLSELQASFETSKLSMETGLKSLSDFKKQVETANVSAEIGALSERIEKVETVPAHIRRVEKSVSDLIKSCDKKHAGQDTKIATLSEKDRDTQRDSKDLVKKLEGRGGLEESKKKTDQISDIRSDVTDLKKKITKLEKDNGDFEVDIIRVASGLIQQTEDGRQSEANEILSRLEALETTDIRGEAVKIFEEELHAKLEASITKQLETVEQSLKDNSERAGSETRGIRGGLSHLVTRTDLSTEMEAMRKTLDDRLVTRTYMEMMRKALEERVDKLETRSSTNTPRTRSSVNSAPPNEELLGLKETTAGHDNRLRETDEKLDSILQTTTEHGNRLHEVEENLERILPMVKDIIKGYLSARFKEFGANNEQRLKQVDERLDSHDVEISQLKQARPQALGTSSGSRISSPQASVSMLENNRLRSDLDALNQEVHNIGQGRNEDINSLGEIHGLVMNLSATVHSHTTTMNSHSGAINSFNGRYDILNRAIQDLTARYENISTDYMSQQMVHVIQQMYPDAPGFLQKLGIIQTEIKNLREHDVRKVKETVHKFEGKWDAIVAAIAQAIRAEGKADKLTGSVEDLWNKVEISATAGRIALEEHAQIEREERNAADEGHAQNLKELNDTVRKHDESISKVDKILAVEPKLQEAIQKWPLMMTSLAKTQTAIVQVNQNAAHPIKASSLGLGDSPKPASDHGDGEDDDDDDADIDLTD
ncbi:hypothetical protein BCR34DRAFT_92770 [Clohesyomyces aquaticus]|uniref:Uncharacterized protein n=1 Tax=Clohesyomyces aquaticus TaxID=1231657 RepID=A0A1Y1YUJ5_9PLEO|nr:hypothetical protein BCR34DRAFT_92770 [Clohesyomyces aquaticus]